jgi:hypothetical protein
VNSEHNCQPATREIKLQQKHTWSKAVVGVALPVSSQSGTVNKLPALAALEWFGCLGGHGWIAVSLPGTNKEESWEESREAGVVERCLPEEVNICKRSGSLADEGVDGSWGAAAGRAMETGSIGRAESMLGKNQGGEGDM